MIKYTVLVQLLFSWSRKLRWVLAVSTLLLVGACSRHAHISKSVLSWEENFNQSQMFDTSRWTKIPRGTSDWNRHMSDFDSCYAMRDGKLILRGIRNTGLPNDTTTYLTGGVYTKDKVGFGFGRLEIKAKLNSAKGAWPAIWMLAENSNWPGGGEIDIMERLSFDTIAYQTVHTHYTLHLNIKDNPKPGATGGIHPTDFNIYAVEKYRDRLVFFINNKKHLPIRVFKPIKKGSFRSISINIICL